MKKYPGRLTISSRSRFWCFIFEGVMKMLLRWPVFRAQLGHRTIVWALEGYWRMDLDELYVQKITAPRDWYMTGSWGSWHREVPNSGNPNRICLRYLIRNIIFYVNINNNLIFRLVVFFVFNLTLALIWTIRLTLRILRFLYSLFSWKYKKTPLGSKISQCWKLRSIFLDK